MSKTEGSVARATMSLQFWHNLKAAEQRAGRQLIWNLQAFAFLNALRWSTSKTERTSSIKTRHRAILPPFSTHTHPPLNPHNQKRPLANTFSLRWEFRNQNPSWSWLGCGGAIYTDAWVGNILKLRFMMNMTSMCPLPFIFNGGRGIDECRPSSGRRPKLKSRGRDPPRGRVASLSPAARQARSHSAGLAH